MIHVTTTGDSLSVLFAFFGFIGLVEIFTCIIKAHHFMEVNIPVPLMVWVGGDTSSTVPFDWLLPKHMAL